MNNVVSLRQSQVGLIVKGFSKETGTRVVLSSDIKVGVVLMGLRKLSVSEFALQLVKWIGNREFLFKSLRCSLFCCRFTYYNGKYSRLITSRTKGKV